MLVVSVILTFNCSRLLIFFSLAIPNNSYGYTIFSYLSIQKSFIRIVEVFKVVHCFHIYLFVFLVFFLLSIFSCFLAVLAMGVISVYFARHRKPIVFIVFLCSMILFN